jgi:hypothetical protein
MRNRTPKTPREETPVDVGTLWTMQRGARTSRCALMASSGRWELRVVVGEEILLSERCDRPDDAFTLADGWKQRMVDQGWCQVVPRSGPRGLLSAFPNI